MEVLRTVLKEDVSHEKFVLVYFQSVSALCNPDIFAAKVNRKFGMDKKICEFSN